MNPEKNLHSELEERERLEREEQAIGEPQILVSQEELNHLIEEKRREEAESRERDIANGWSPDL